MLEFSASSEDIRRAARELITRHGKAACMIAEWNAVAAEDEGRLEDSKRWMIIAGTIQAMTED
jgi:hypothetical protein